MAVAFRFKANLPDLPKGAERALIEQFRAIQTDLDDIRGPAASVTPIVATRYSARVGELVLLAPPAAGQLVTIPAGNASNLGRALRIAVVAGLLSPGVTVSIVGGQGTINGLSVLNLNSYRLVELISVGPLGWWYSS